MTAWIPVDRELPPLNVPVWLFLPAIRQSVIGCLSVRGEGRQWCRCFDDFWFDGASWQTSTADVEYDHPSHWMPLPTLPGERPVCQEPLLTSEHLRVWQDIVEMCKRGRYASINVASKQRSAAILAVDSALRAMTTAEPDDGVLSGNGERETQHA